LIGFYLEPFSLLFQNSTFSIQSVFEDMATEGDHENSDPRVATTFRNHDLQTNSTHVENKNELPGICASNSMLKKEWGEVLDARPILPKAAFFMGDLRDGLPMVR
jgi:hypothetical protein